MFVWWLFTAAKECIMATPHAVAIELSEADRAVLLSWTRRRKTAQGLALRARIVLTCADSASTNTAIAEAMGLRAA
jgi:hypothetical protein